jgi:hypothetical protein
MFCQDMEELFEDYIPEEIKIDNENYRQVLETLNRDAQLNPELIYFRLNYYDLRFKKGYTNNSKNGFNEVRSLVSQELQRRNNWLDEQILKVKGYKQRSDFVSDIEEYFASLKSEINVDESFSIGPEKDIIQKIDFFICRYLSEDSNLKFDEKIDYAKLRNSLEADKKENFIQIYSDLISLNSELSTEYIREKVFQHWHLFPIRTSTEKELDAYEIFLAQLEKEYSSETLDRFVVLVGSRYYFLDEISQFKIYPEESSDGIQIAEVYNKFGFTAQIGYRFFLSNSYSILSYINTNLNFSLSSSSEITETDSIIYKRKYSNDRDFTSENWSLEEPDVSDREIKSIYLRASTPVFIIGKFFSLELGFMVGLSYLTYDVTYSYQYTKVSVDWDEQNGGYHSTLLARYTVEDREETESQTNFRIYPTVDVNIQLIKPLIFQISTGYNFVEVKAGMTF